MSKQETLEEAAERLYPIVIKPILDVYDDGVSNQIGKEDINENNRESFIEGAKWQAKRMYSEEDMIAFGKSCFYKGFEKAENDDANCYTAFREEIGILVEQFKKK
jgi:hypothetical protein